MTTSNNEIKLFDFESTQVRVFIDENNEPWFVAKDVAQLLGYKNTRKAIIDHCKNAVSDGVTIRDAIGRDQKMTIIPERDLYRLVMKSKLPSAERFEEWVVGDVLPSIRKTGSYVSTETMVNMMTSPDSLMTILANWKKDQEEKMRLEQIAKSQQMTIAVMAPKVDYFDTMISTSSTLNSTAVGKTLKMSAKVFNKKLHEKGYIFKRSGKWFPYAKYQDSGYFEVKPSIYQKGTDKEGTTVQLRFTTKGMHFFQELFKNPEPQTPSKTIVVEAKEPEPAPQTPVVKQLGLFDQQGNRLVSESAAKFSAAHYFTN